jgi:hypothetical protein
MTSASPPGNDGVTFGRVVPPVPESAAPDAPPPGTDDAAGHRDELDELVRRAGSLSSLQVCQLATAAAWRWSTLGLPAGGTLAAARATAIGAGRLAGRGWAVEMAQNRARQATIESLNSTASEAGWPGAETALLALVIGAAGAMVTIGAGATAVSILFVILALIGGVVLLFLESGYVRRMRLLQAVSAVALATVTRDLIEPGTVELLAGPWLSVMRD